MDMDWNRYQSSYYYRLKVAQHYLDKQSSRLKKRFTKAVIASLWRRGVILLLLLIGLWYASAPVSVYGLVMVGWGATILGWTAFRVHERRLLDASAVPDDRKGDTPQQERVTHTSLNYVDAAVGVLLIASGYAVRVVGSIGL